MTIPESVFSNQRTQLIKEQLRPDTRIAILGATGWFGQTILDIASKAGIETIGFASRQRDIQVGGRIHKIVKWSSEKITEFSPTTIVDCAFLTPDRMKDLGVEEYVSINKELIANFIKSCESDSVRSAISISSGAAVNTSVEKSKSIYGELKTLTEQKLAEITERKSINSVIARVWSVSGVFCTNTDNYAFSNFISQAKSGEVVLKSEHAVWRRYCSAADFLTIALALSEEDGNHILESGGELIELHELAHTIQQRLNPEITPGKSIALGDKAENYSSDGSSWALACKRFGFKPLSIHDQITEITDSLSISD